MDSDRVALRENIVDYSMCIEDFCNITLLVLGADQNDTYRVGVSIIGVMESNLTLSSAFAGKTSW